MKTLIYATASLWLCLSTLSETRSAPVVFWRDSFQGTGPELGGGTRALGDPDHTSATDGTGAGVGGVGDYFVRTTAASDSSSGMGQTFTNVQPSAGSFYWRGEDLDGIPNISVPETITWSGINISGLSNLTFGGYFGATDDATTPRWELDDFIRVQAQIDGGALQELIDFQATELSGESRHLAVDSNDDDNGDGLRLDTDLHHFDNLAITGAGDFLTLILTTNINGNNEEFAFDHFTVSSNAVPEPSSFLLLGLVAVGGVAYRWREQTQTFQN